MTRPPRNITNQIIEYECGQLSEQETLELFAELIKSGLAWTLQGSYGRMATALINQKLITPEGDIVDPKKV